MSDPYAAVKPGRLTFKGGGGGGGGGGVATQSKSIHKKKNKKRHQKNNEQEPASDLPADTPPPPENIYTIDAAKKMNYEELFPVEAKKFSYRHPKAKETSFSSVEEALDDRVKKKADRYCK